MLIKLAWVVNVDFYELFFETDKQEIVLRFQKRKQNYITIWKNLSTRCYARSSSRDLMMLLVTFFENSRQEFGKNTP